MNTEKDLLMKILKTAYDNSDFCKTGYALVWYNWDEGSFYVASPLDEEPPIGGGAQVLEGASQLVPP